MWQADFLIIAFALGSLCLAIIPKASFTSKKSNAGRHFGSLDIGTTPILNKSRESNGTTSQAGFEDAEGYQSDQPASAAWHELVVSKIRQLNPTVYCDGDTMTLSVQGRTIPNFLIDGIPLLQIPENCGFSFTQAPTQAAFTVHYHGCHVTQQGDDYVLLLRLWGISMKMSCPMAIYTHNVSCLSSGMVTKLDCDSANVLKLKVNGKWDPFIPASRTCGITTESETDGVVLSAPYQSSCWQIKGDERFLSVLYGNEELTLSCPDSNDFYIYGRVETISDQSNEPDVVTSMAISMTTGPASDSEQPHEATSSLTTTVPTITSTRKTVDIMSPFPQRYSPFGPMLYQHKPKPYGYPWAFPSKPPTTTTTTSQGTDATVATTVAKDPEQPQYPFHQMYYPYGAMPYHYNRRHYGYLWAFPPKAPTTAPTGTSSKAPATTVARTPGQPQYPFPQMYYPYGAMPNHYKPRPYGYPWAFPSKPPTTASTTTTSPTTSQDTDTTATTVPRNPEQPQYPFPQMYYPYGPMSYHYKPRPYGYPWAFLSKPPTTAPTTLSPTTSQDAATTATTVARNPEQLQYPFPQMYYPYGPMPYHYKPRPYGYPWAFLSKPPTTAPTTPQDAATTATTVAGNPEQPQYPFPQMYYPYGPMPYHYKPRPYGYPWAFLSKPPTMSPTTSQDAATTATTVPRNPEQPQYPFPQMYYPYGLMPYNQKPMPYGYPWTYPEKAPATTPIKITSTTTPVTASQTSATVLNSVANDTYQSGYPSHHMYSPFGPMHCHHGPSDYHGYPFAFPAKVFTTAPNILASTTKTATARNVATTATPPIIASNRQQLSYPFYPTSSPFGPMLYHPKPMSFGHPWAFLPQEHQLLPKG